MEQPIWNALDCHTHIESGRKYVGLTSRTMERRWSQHIIQANFLRVADSIFPMLFENMEKKLFP
jgi:hypothetical protein